MLVRPAPFPQEADLGYLGRVMRLNGITSKKAAVTLMSIWAGVAGKTKQEISCLELLSKMAGMELPFFAQQHTTLPLRRAITSYHPELPHGSKKMPSMLWTTGMRLSRDEAYFCPKCVQEDLDFHGQSFWRRRLHIPGLLWCQQHSVPLRYVAKGKLAFLSPPSSFIEQSISVDEDWAEEAIQNRHIRKYVEICTGLMDWDAPLDVIKVAAILKEKASGLGFQTCNGAVNRPLLSDAVVTAFGRRWLATVLAKLADKEAGVLLSQMDGVLYLNTSASSVNAYALACAILYESADAALNALQAPAICAKKIRKSYSKNESEELINTYVQARGNYSATARLMSVSRSEVAAKLKAVGLPNLSESPNKNSFVAAYAFYVEEQSLQQSVAIGKMSMEAMGDLIRSAGTELAPALRKMTRPTGRGSGKRRAKQLAPEEARLASGRVAVKFSQDTRREKKRASQIEDTEVQNVAQ